MGYTHPWSRIETPNGPLPGEPHDAYGRLALDTLAIIHAAEQAGVALADGAARPGSQPRVTEGGIWLNGARSDHAETFVWPAQAGEPWWTETPGHRWTDACKTNRRPYDLVICAVLIRAGTHYGASVRITSDGDWHGTTIDGRWWPEWMPARQLVTRLFGPDADACPFPP